MQWRTLFVRLLLKIALPLVGHTWVCTRILQDDGMTEGWALGTPEYAALFMLFTVLLVGLNYDWIYPKTAWGRMLNIANEASTLSRMLFDYAERSELRRDLRRPIVMRGLSETRVVTSIHAMARILEAHSIPHPNTENIEDWTVFTAELEAVCRHSWTMKGVRGLYTDE